MSLDRSLQHGPNSTFGATVATKCLPRFTCGELLAAVIRILDGTGARAELVASLTTFEAGSDRSRIWSRPKAPPRVGMDVNGITVVIEGRDRSAFGSVELAELEFRLWPGGEAAISRAWAHVSVSEVSAAGAYDADDNFVRAAAVTAVTAAVAELTAAVGVVWCTSRCAIPGEQLSGLTGALVSGEAPTDFWVTVSERQGAAAATRGLYALIGAEVEVQSSTLPHATARTVAMEVAKEIICAGQPPAEDEILVYARKTDFRVWYRDGDGTRSVPAVVLSDVTGARGSGFATGAA